MMEALDVLDVLDLLAESQLEAILDGGWGVDALLGAQHRDHDDLDLVVGLDRAEVAIAALATVGLTITEDHRPTRVVLTDTHGRAVDLHHVRTDAAGDRWQAAAAPDGSDARYGADQLTTGWVGGRKVRCIGPELQALHHAGYEPRPRDRHDLELLQQMFGVTPPDGYR